jgi:hypothetical protein
MKYLFKTSEEARQFIRLPAMQEKHIVIRKANHPTVFATYWMDRRGWQMCWSTPDAYNLETVRVSEDAVADAVSKASGEAIFHECYVEFNPAPTSR